MGPIFVLIFIIVVISCGAFYISYKRKKDIEALALASGLSFDPEASGLPGFSGIELFGKGHSQKTSNLLTPAASGECKTYFFDYSYTTGSGKHRHTHSFTVGVFEFSRILLPQFTLRPENLLDKVGEYFGFQDIDIQGFPVFSKEYKLTGPDNSTVLAFFAPNITNYFEQNPGWHVFVSGNYIAVYKKEGLVPVSEYQQYMESVKNLAKELVRF